MKETLKETAERLKIEWKIDRPQDFIAGYKLAQERSYSEEDMINFADFKTSNLMKHCDKKGMYLGTKKVFNMWCEKFKKI